jgi:hypothetical protein
LVEWRSDLSKKPIDLEEELARNVGVRFDRNEFQREQLINRLDSLRSQQSRDSDELQRELQKLSDQLLVLTKIGSDIKYGVYFIAFLFIVLE